MRSNLAGPLVASLLRRNGQSMRWAATQLGLSHVALSERLRGAGPALGVDGLLAVAGLAHASQEELDLVADLDALDRGALPLDEHTTPAELRAARAAILQSRAGT